MAGTRKAPLWRQAFLRALKRTGNVRASAFEAGVDPGTAYDHRAKDAGFRAKWAAAKAAYGAGPPSRKASADKGEELVLRRTKHGDKLVRASPGGWSQRIEESFLDGLEETGCVRTAARAAGISTAALYERRKHYPDFAARWDERAGRAVTQLPGLLNRAAVESMSPQPEGAKRRGRARLPKLEAGEAIRIYAINENAKAKARGRSDGWRRPPQLKDHKASILKKLSALDRQQRERRLAEGWTELEEGIWLPPGWTAQRPEAPPAPDGGGQE
jgi:hypothetical protein